MIRKLVVILLVVLNMEASGYNSLLFNGNCVTCHFEKESVSAPSVIELQVRYKDAFPVRDDFIEYMSTWVQYPNAETSIMHDAIKKYELMPELGYDLDTLRSIAEYIYDTDFKALQSDPKVRKY